jgi:hypothetical protein
LSNTAEALMIHIKDQIQLPHLLVMPKIQDILSLKKIIQLYKEADLLIEVQTQIMTSIKKELLNINTTSSA